jgi:hypothetical protein
MEPKSKSSPWRRSSIYVLAIFVAWTGLNYLCEHSKYSGQIRLHTAELVEQVKKVDCLYLARTFFSRFYDCVEYSGCTKPVPKLVHLRFGLRPVTRPPEPPPSGGLTPILAVFPALRYTAKQLWASGWQVIIPSLSSLLIAVFGLLWMMMRSGHETANGRRVAFVTTGSPAEKQPTSIQGSKSGGGGSMNPLLMLLFVCAVFLLGALLQFAFKWMLVGVLYAFGTALALLTWVAYVLQGIEMYLRFRHAKHLVEVMGHVHKSA